MAVTMTVAMVMIVMANIRLTAPKNKSNIGQESIVKTLWPGFEPDTSFKYDIYVTYTTRVQ